MTIVTTLRTVIMTVMMTTTAIIIISTKMKTVLETMEAKVVDMTYVAITITKTIPHLALTLSAPVLIAILLAGVHSNQVAFLLVEAPKMTATVLVPAIIILEIASVVA